MGRPSHQKRLRSWLIGLGLMTALPGCFLLPTYHQPQGFSSTYYRHLQELARSQGATSDSTFAPTVYAAPAETTETGRSNSSSDLNWMRPPTTARQPANSKAETPTRQ